MSKTASSAIEQFMALFHGYEHACGLFFPGKTAASGKAEGRFQTPTRSATREDYETHLKGTGPSLGLVPLLTDLTCHFGALDIDIKGQHALHEPVEKLEARVRKLELPLVFCLSKSGGAHLYLFGSEPLPAKLLRQKLAEFAKILGYPGCEVFPKQETRKPGDTGNWINLPYAGALSEQGTNRFCIRNGKPIKSLEEFVKYADMMRINGAELQATQSQPATATIDEGGRNNRLHKLACQWRGMGWSQELIEDNLLNVNQSLCDPPMSEKDVRGIARRGSKYEPNPVPDEEGLLIVGQPPKYKRMEAIDSILYDMPEAKMFRTPVTRRFTHIIEYRESKQDSNIKVKRDPHAPVMVDVDPVWLTVVLSRSGKVRTYTRKGELIEADPKREDAESFISCVKNGSENLKQRVLTMLSTKPILLDDTIVSKPGYHEASGIYIVNRNIQFDDPNPDEVLSAEECRALMERDLYPPFRAYPFLKEEPEQKWYDTASFSVVLSGALCVALRNLIPATPGHCITAPGQASGKTALVQAISALATGMIPTGVPYDGAEEFGKLLPVLLMKGDPVIHVENIDMVLNNRRLAMGLTGKHTMTVRVLGQTADKVVENYSVHFLEGNNLQLTGDIPTRCLITRFDADCEHPEHREFDFYQEVEAMELHPTAIMTMLRVARAHARAGFPEWDAVKKMPMRKFNEYDQRVRALLRWTGHADPIVTQGAIRANDPGHSVNVELMWILAEHFGRTPFFIHQIDERTLGIDFERFKELTGHKAGEPYSTQKVAQFFAAKVINKRVAGFKLTKTGRTPKGKTEWQLEYEQEVKVKRAEEEEI